MQIAFQNSSGAIVTAPRKGGSLPIKFQLKKNQTLQLRAVCSPYCKIQNPPVRFTYHFLYDGL